MPSAKSDKPRQPTVSFPFDETERARMARAQAAYEKELNIPLNMTDTFRVILARLDRYMALDQANTNAKNGTP